MVFQFQIILMMISDSIQTLFFCSFYTFWSFCAYNLSTGSTECNILGIHGSRHFTLHKLCNCESIADSLHQAIITIICKFHQKRLNQKTCRVVRNKRFFLHVPFLFRFCLNVHNFHLRNRNRRTKCKESDIYLAKWMRV